MGERFAESSREVTKDHAKVTARGQVASPPSVVQKYLAHKRLPPP